MKTFFKLDYYLQVFVFLATIIGILIFVLFKDKSEALFFFYFIVGGSQLLSFLVRLLLKYPKDLIYKLYGWFIMPIWIGFLPAIIDISAISYLYTIVLLGAFYSPAFSLIYIVYCHKTSKL